MRSCCKVIRAIPVFLIPLIVCSLLIGNGLAYAQSEDSEYMGVKYTIIAQTISTPTGTHNIPFDNYIYAKPYLYSKTNSFDVTFKIKPSWDGNALAAAYIPADLEIYKCTNPQYQGEIISKRLVNVGLIAVFRGSPYHYGSLPNGDTYSIKYVLHNVTLHLHLAIKKMTYTYVITIFMKKYNETEAKVEAWLKARAGISAQLKLLNFIKAGFNLASIEAGVKAEIIKKVKVESGCKVTVAFSIPTYKHRITYTAAVYVEEDYNAKGNGSLPTSRSLSPSSTVSRVYYFNLEANGKYVGYSDYKEMIPFTADKQLDLGGTIDTKVFIKA
ncbi:MAG: hypothetical protein GXO43_04010 [Crenarchaeota archaeon]|nr:hypothetical protein [Thermoproteota archaeon]